MEISSRNLAIFVGCCIVTIIPRVIPFIINKKVTLPKVVIEFLGFLPYCILVALLFQSILVYKEGEFPTFDIPKTLALIPAIIVSIKTKNVMKTVIVAVISIALIRLFV